MMSFQLGFDVNLHQDVFLYVKESYIYQPNHGYLTTHKAPIKWSVKRGGLAITLA